MSISNKYQSKFNNHHFSTIIFETSLFEPTAIVPLPKAQEWNAAAAAPVINQKKQSCMTWPYFATEWQAATLIKNFLTIPIRVRTTEENFAEWVYFFFSVIFYLLSFYWTAAFFDLYFK